MSGAREHAEVLVLGGGLAGLATARGFGRGALVLEAAERVGGLARSEPCGEWTFDHALHVLYFPDAATRERVFELPGLHAAPCPPVAWVHTTAGTTRYPIQMHLSGLEPGARSRSLSEIEAASAAGNRVVNDFESLLRKSFGDTLCELFFLPYNRKVWRRSLHELAATGFQWNIQVPDLAMVRAGAREDAEHGAAYNADGWYPRPPDGAPVLGIECLPRALANGLEVRLSRRVTRLQLAEHLISATGREVPSAFTYDRACVSTLPLPALVACTEGVPDALRRDVEGLRWNRVVMVAFALRGPRPARHAHWTYWPHEDLCFHRTIHPHCFDPRMAPADGWSLMAEIAEPSEAATTPPEGWIERVERDARRAGALPANTRIEFARSWVVDPAYVVFRPGERVVVERACEWFAERSVYLVGRYGRWEYSSMAQVMRDGFALGDRLRSDARGPAR